jgi:hypothetical protein
LPGAADVVRLSLIRRIVEALRTRHQMHTSSDYSVTRARIPAISPSRRRQRTGTFKLEYSPSVGSLLRVPFNSRQVVGSTAAVSNVDFSKIHHRNVLVSFVNPTTSSMAFHSEMTFVDPKDKFWSLYLEGAEAEDKARVENWKGDTDGILIFVRVGLP